KEPDLEVLDAVYRRFTAGHEGLELVWFLDVRDALRRYKEMAPNVGDPAVQARYGKLLDFLAERLGAYAAGPTAEDALLIGQAVRQLEEFRQAPELVAAIRHHYLRPNLLMSVSADVIAAGIEYPVDETAPVREVILGTDIYGTGHTTGRVRAELLAEESRAVIEAVFRGTVKSRNVGYNGPVKIFSNASTRAKARKRLWIDATGLGSRPAVSSAVTKTTITGIQARRGGRCIERLAWKRTCKQKAQAECIAARRAERRLSDQIDQRAEENLSKANRAFTDKFRKPLVDRRLFPQQLRFTTSRTSLQVVSLQADDSQLAAPTAPPELPEGCDLALSLHESAINNLASSALAGMTLRDEGFEAAVVQLLGELPEQLKPDEEQQGWGIAFWRRRDRQPLSVSFAEGGFRVTIRGRRFYRDDESHPGMNVTAIYKIVQTGQEFRAVRQGDLEILPPDFKPGQTLGADKIAIRKLLERRFGKVFKKEIMGEGFVLPGKWSQAGKMSSVHLASEDGWLTIGWKRTPAEQTVARTHHNPQRPATLF
ncbi:MAG: hypothetical protein ACYSWU_24145, partial [Planctomycetota bacterium]